MVSDREKLVFLRILDSIRDMPCLWQKKHREYKNKQVRFKCYTELLEIYKELDENATMTRLKKRLENMRTMYLKELHKVIASKKPGATEDEIHVPTLWYYEAFNFLSFLGKEIRATSDTENEENESTTEDSGVQESSRSIFLPSYEPPEEAITVATTSSIDSVMTSTSSRPDSPLERKKRPRYQLKYSDAHTRSQSLHEELTSAEEMAFDMFGRSVGMQLKTLSTENALLAQSRIQSILTEIGITDHRQKAAEKFNKS